MVQDSQAKLRVRGVLQEPHQRRRRKLGVGTSPYFRHGDVLYPVVYVAAVGTLCSLHILPPWLIILLLIPLYVGGVKLVIVRGTISSS